ncbi:MAG TPA: histidine phosphatase family protein [Comamonadaceae bacterium]|nr:MAG: phosphoglycerate mutase [Burkholderiales bacterium RIFCSPLOWO2_12_FULL_65_40]HCE27442.1 histidine phosphatase family protein [Comamonadaceae bacterium]
MQATRIIAIRHGETAWNVDTRIQGHLDIPLNDTGLWQARQLARALAGEPLSAIYASDLQRAHTTARAIAETTGAPLVPEPALRERSFGELEGRTFAEIEAELPEQARRWRQRDPHFAPEGGETLVQLRERIAATTHRLAAQHTGGLVVLVAHGGVLDVLYRLATGQELQAPRTWQLTNAAINRLLWTPEGLTLVGWADTQHLDTATRDETTA